MKPYGDVVVNSVRAMLADWRQGSEIEIGSAMTRLARGVMIETLFGTDAGADTDELADAISIRRRYFERVMTAVFPFSEFGPSRIVWKSRQAIEKIDSAIYRAIEMRRRTEDSSDDLLARLMRARYEDGTGMNDKQVRDEAMTFLNTGHETIAAALTWTWLLLSRHPNVEAKLTAEVHEVLNGLPPSADDISKLHYAKMVLAESMRLYPPTWMFVRVARSTDTLPSGTVIPAGSKLYLSPYVMHRQPRYFPDPERFDPERFTDQAMQGRPRYAYFPFGSGPRSCIGETFAHMECVLVITSIVQRFQLKLVSGHPVVPEVGTFLRPKNGILMRLERRSGPIGPSSDNPGASAGLQSGESVPLATDLEQ
jgi:cytochrome P450